MDTEALEELEGKKVFLVSRQQKHKPGHQRDFITLLALSCHGFLP
jgi:hypothetical protein